jgi:hypothetical protein
MSSPASLVLSLSTCTPSLPVPARRYESHGNGLNDASSFSDCVSLSRVYICWILRFGHLFPHSLYPPQDEVWMSSPASLVLSLSTGTPSLPVPARRYESHGNGLNDASSFSDCVSLSRVYICWILRFGPLFPQLSSPAARIVARRNLYTTSSVPRLSSRVTSRSEFCRQGPKLSELPCVVLTTSGPTSGTLPSVFDIRVGLGRNLFTALSSWLARCSFLAFRILLLAILHTPCSLPANLATYPRKSHAPV